MNLFILIFSMDISKSFHKKISKKSLKFYSLYFVFFISILTFFISAFTMFVDPYFIFSNRRIEKVNKWRMRSKIATRSSKPLRFVLLKPKNIILGSSTAEVGLDPSYKKWRDGKGYNFSFSGGSLSEVESVLKLAIEYKIDEAILVTDFVRFFPYQNRNNLQISGIKNNPIGHIGNSKFLVNWFNVIFSPAVIRDALDTVIYQNIDPEFSKSQHYLEDNGSRAPFYNFNRVSNEGYQKAAIKILNKRLGKQWLNLCNINYINSDQETFPGLTYFSNILKLAHQNQIKLTILFPPIHVTAHMALSKSNKYELYEKWKKLLINENNLIAKKMNTEPYPFYDFGIINNYTLEEIPSDKASSRMKWFTDPFHFTKNYGNKIMDYIFNEDSKNTNNFGLKVDLNSIENHLKYNKITLNSLLSDKNKFNSIISNLKLETKSSCIN